MHTPFSSSILISPFRHPSPFAPPPFLLHPFSHSSLLPFLPNILFLLPQMDQKTGTNATHSRKARRKTKNLQVEYSRRQRKNAWLETHIWHAKRMHMIDNYGYRVAHRPNDKGLRQAYLSMKYGCLLMVSVMLCTLICLPKRKK